MRQVGSVLWPKLKTIQIYGANTGVGKTVIAALLCKALTRSRRGGSHQHVSYLKPISTGPLDEADDNHLSRFSKNVKTKTLIQFDDSVSPHLAARTSKQQQPYDDNSILSRVQDELNSYATAGQGYAVVETAGGVLSPAPSGSTQADLYRPLRLPVLLVGDHRLGGIGSTISAWESLHVRGYDVGQIMLFEDSVYGNAPYLKDYFRERGVLTLALQPPPEQLQAPEEDHAAMAEYYETVSGSPALAQCIDSIDKSHQQHIESLTSLPARAHKSIWHPFMQHTERSEKSIFTIDSAYGDFFQSLKKPSDSASVDPNANILRPAFDGSASWWTQGLGHGNPKLALTTAHTAGRYGHVMFAGAAHEPAVALAELLLSSLGNPRLSRVFYTDNGSAGMEVAVKMALKASTRRFGWDPKEDDIQILGLKGSYHGDTMGTMDCSEPSVYNAKVEWYRGRGHWFDFPQVKMTKGRWVVSMPGEMQSACGTSLEYDSLDEVFAFGSRPDVAAQYEKFIAQELQKLARQGRKFGALILEPVILGAGGMLFADPLFQHSLVKVVRDQGSAIFNTSGSESQQHAEHEWQGMPVIFDEIFTGLYRLGRRSPSTFLDIKPDISAHAKLLTGGLLPLCTTLASESIYEAFLSPDKTDALLHGHSYTAHAVGCDVARHSVQTMIDMESNKAWKPFQDKWISSGSAKATTAQEPGTWSLWSKTFVRDISFRDDVEGVIALGSVLAISMKDAAGSGYTSSAGAGLRDRLLQGDGDLEQVVHSRVLGNVLYLMTSMTTSPETVAAIEGMVVEALDR